jgi:hypothetical protein
MIRFRFTSILVAAAAALGIAGPAAAQAPNVTSVLPAGGQVGTKATVTVGGANLQGATALLVAGEGVQAQITKNTEAASLPVELTIAPNVAPGVREVRVVTPRGTSNAGRIWVGSYPEAVEVEPNNTVAAAQKLEKVPLTMNGQVGAEDTDSYVVQANAGDTYVFDLVAYRIGSGLDGYLQLFDAKGKHLAYSQEAYDRDPRIIYTFKTAGAYVIQVRDTMFRGGGNFTYRLTAGKLPVVTGYLPLGGKRGQTVNVNLEGVNLGDMKTMPVQIPADGDQVSVVPNTPAGPVMNPISLQASDLNEVVETEPNDAAGQATVIPDAPVVVNGRMDKPGDVDLFRLKPAAAANLSFEIHGRRIGSRLDSFLRILDTAGKEVQGNDDIDPNTKDSRLVFGVQAGTEYLVEVRSQDRRYGGDVFYRLKIDPPSGQDFRLRVTPDNLNVGQGGSAVVTVNITRISGFGGPVQLRVEGLPAGMTASYAVIPQGAATGQFTLTAEAGAATGTPGQIKVIGSATIDGKTVERVAQPAEPYRPPLAQDDQIRQRPTVFHVATVAPPLGYTLNIEPREVTVKRGTSVQIKVTATRQMGQNGQINIQVAGQPPNVNPALQNIAQNANEATITLNVAANAPTVTQNVIITGNMNNNIQAAPALKLTITE